MELNLWHFLVTPVLSLLVSQWMECWCLDFHGVKNQPYDWRNKPQLELILGYDFWNVYGCKT